MEIKAEVTRKYPQDTMEYPCIKVAESGRIVLFHKPDCGVQLNLVRDASYAVGHYSPSWCERDFQPFVGSVTLTQE